MRYHGKLSGGCPFWFRVIADGCRCQCRMGVMLKWTVNILNSNIWIIAIFHSSGTAHTPSWCSMIWTLFIVYDEIHSKYIWSFPWIRILFYLLAVKEWIFKVSSISMIERMICSIASLRRVAWRSPLVFWVYIFCFKRREGHSIDFCIHKSCEFSSRATETVAMCNSLCGVKAYKASSCHLPSTQRSRHACNQSQKARLTCTVSPLCIFPYYPRTLLRYDLRLSSESTLSHHPIWRNCRISARLHAVRRCFFQFFWHVWTPHISFTELFRS